MLAGVMATVVTCVVAYGAALVTYRLGWDPDNNGVPLVSSASDFLGAVVLHGGAGYPGPFLRRLPRQASVRRSDGRRPTSTKSQGHALGGEGHLRAHGRPRVRRTLLRRRGDGRRGRTSSRSVSATSSTRCARSACSRRGRPAKPSRCRACCTSCRRSSGWRTPRSTSRASSRHRLGIPRRPRGRPRRGRGDLAPGAHPPRLGARAAHARRGGAARRGGHAGHGDPPGQGVADRPRRRRHAGARRRADPAGLARRHRRAARARRRARVAPADASTTTPRSPISTAPSTCWWR